MQRSATHRFIHRTAVTSPSFTSCIILNFTQLLLNLAETFALAKADSSDNSAPPSCVSEQRKLHGVCKVMLCISAHWETLRSVSFEHLNFD